VTLGASRANGTFSIEVRNRGPAVAAGDLDKLFRPGYTTKAGGSGFGLFLARRLAEVHGGSLSAQPERGGMAFTLTLPVRDPGGRE